MITIKIGGSVVDDLHQSTILDIKKIAEIAHLYPNHKFIMPIANKYNTMGGRKNKNRPFEKR